MANARLFPPGCAPVFCPLSLSTSRVIVLPAQIHKGFWVPNFRWIQWNSFVDLGFHHFFQLLHSVTTLTGRNCPLLLVCSLRFPFLNFIPLFFQALWVWTIFWSKRGPVHVQQDTELWLWVCFPLVGWSLPQCQGLGKLPKATDVDVMTWKKLWPRYCR